jgi:hypothetical protein
MMNLSNSIVDQNHTSAGLWIRLGFRMFVSLALFLGGCGSTQTEAAPHLAATIPAQSDWIDCGTIFSAGAEGDWDHILWGGFANSIVKKDGTYYLYYQGSSEYDEGEGTVAWRSIGVATSTDGINFAKYERNPVLTWFPRSNLEEGAASGGAFLDENGNIAIYYGANTWAGTDQVNADARLAVSSDGLHFTDVGAVLNHTNSSIWGSGDEIFPIIGFHDAGRWFTYYIPNGSPQTGQLGVAWGNDRDSLANSSAVQSGGVAVAVWGPGGYGRIGEDVYALFLNNIRAANGLTFEVRTVSLSNPASLSAPVHRYQFPNAVQATVILDSDTSTWFMYYRNSDQDGYGVMMAPADGRDLSCPMSAAPPSAAQQIYLPFIKL